MRKETDRTELDFHLPPVSCYVYSSQEVVLLRAECIKEELRKIIISGCLDAGTKLPSRNLSAPE